MLGKKILLSVLSLATGALVIEYFSGRLLEETNLEEKLKYAEEKAQAYHQPDIYCLDEDLGSGYKPGAEGRVVTSDFDVTYTINSKGLRDKEIYLPKPKQEKRIILLGDSNVFGDGIEYGKRFSEIIENKLEKTEVVNMGRQGYGMDQSFLQLSRDGFGYGPDLVLLFITFDGYLERCRYFWLWGGFKPRFVLADGSESLVLQGRGYLADVFGQEVKEERKKKPGEALPAGRETFFDNSRLIRLLKSYRKRERIRQASQNKDKEFWQGVKSMYKGSDLSYSREEFKRIIYLLLKKYRNVCKKEDVDLLVAGCGIWENKFIYDFCADLGIDYLDLTGILYRASKQKPVTFEADPHYNEFANRIIAGCLSDYISSNYPFRKQKRQPFNPQ